MNLKKKILKQILFYFYREGRILLSKFLKEFRFFYLIHIKRDKSCRKICSNWYEIKIPAQGWSASGGKKQPRHQRIGTPTEASEKLNWKEKYFDLQKQFFILEKKFRQQYFKFGTTRAVAVFLCIALIITAGWQMIWNMSRAAGAAAWDFSNSANYTAAANVEVDASDNNMARLKQNYIPGTNWIATDGDDYDWTYRHEVTIDNSALEYDSSNVQLKITLSSTNFDFSIPDSQGSDIRFTGSLARTNYATEQERLNAQATNEISYYKESYDQSAKTAVFWVNLPNIYSFWGVATENSGTDNKLKVDDVSGFPDPADFPSGEIPVTVRDTTNSETNYITAIDGDTKELTFKNNFSVSFLTALTAQVRYIEDEQVYLYYGNSNAIVSTSSQSNTFTTTDTPEANLVGYWKFDDGSITTTHDFSGEGNTGTVTSGLSLRDGPVGPAMSFLSSKNISVPSSSELSPTDAVSVEFWIYPTGRYSDWGNIIYKSSSYVVSWEGWNARMRWTVGGCGGGWAGGGVPTLSYNTWTHVVATYDKNLGSNQMNMYFNGVVGETLTCTGSITANSNPLVMITDSSVSATKPNGLDEVRVYNKALSQGEVTAHYNLGRATPPILTVQSSQSLYPSIWQYQRAITINNSTGGALTNYQVSVSLTALNFDFSHANSNGSDIRFTDSDADTELDYWIESYDSAAQTATIWVEVPSISASSTKTIYMYHGNRGAGVASNRSDTMVVLNFENETVGQSASNFVNYNGGTNVIKGGKIVENYGHTSGYSYYNGGQYSDFVYENRFVLTSDRGGGATFRASGNNLYFLDYYTSGSTVDLYKVVNGSRTSIASASVTVAAGTWYDSKVICAGNSIKVYHNGVLKIDITDNTYSTGYVGMGANVYGRTMQYDDFIIRNYSPTDPVSTVGSETAVAWPSTEVAKLIVNNNTGQPYVSLSSFAQTLGVDNAGSVKYQISNNDTDWYWYNSGSGDWEVASGLLQTNTAADVNTNISTFASDIHPGEIGTFYFKSFFVSDGTQKVELDSIDLGYIYDTLPPTDPVAATGYSDNGKATPIVTNSWYNHTKPYFEFGAATDQADTGNVEQATGVAGYW
ncbi:MAG: DUF2341 domain-containing protein, partial [Patescibacteria group bacterium]|nr:DUF2341 domain-containing protein [Patescibacteria group bacterium]